MTINTDFILLAAVTIVIMIACIVWIEWDGRAR